MALFGNFLTHISKKTLHTILWAVFALIVLFFAATRTQVGRDELGRQIEAQFEGRFAGQLQIGGLTGNLLNTLFATNIEVRDPSGLTVIKIDSMIIRPKWTHLLRKKFSLHELILINPNFFIEFDQNGDTNLARVFVRSDTLESEDKAESEWNLKGVAFEIRNGQIATRSPMPINKLVASGSLFDVGNSSVDGVSIRANLDFSEEGKQIDILRVSGHLRNPNMVIESGESQFLIKNERITINQFAVLIGSTDLSLTGFWDLKSDLNETQYPPFLIEVESDNVNFDQLNLLFPNSPLRGSASFSAYVQGPLSELIVSWVRLRKNETGVEVAGTITGYPGTLVLDLSLANSFILTSDLSELLPKYSIEKTIKAPSFTVSAYVQGVVELQNTIVQSLEGRGSFELNSEGSELSGSVLLGGSLDSLSHQISLQARQIDLAAWTARPQLKSDISGTFRANGYTVDTDKIYTSVTGTINDLKWTTRRLGQVEFDLDVEPQNIGGRLVLTDQNSKIDVEGDIILTDKPWVQFVSRFTDSNFGALLGKSDLQTEFNGQIEASASLEWNDNFEGSISIGVDSSWVTMTGETTTISPFDSKIDFGKPATNAEPLLSFTSDFATILVNGTGSVPVWSKLASSWISGLKGTALSEFNKTMYADSQQIDSFPESALEDLLTWEDARTAFVLGGYKAPLSATMQIEVLDGRMFSQLSPRWSSLKGQTRLTSKWLMSPDTVQIHTDIDELTGSRGSSAVFGSKGTLSLKAGRKTSISRSLAWSVTIDSDSIRVGSNSLRHTILSSEYEDRFGSIIAKSKGTESIDSLLVSFEIANRDRYNEAKLTALEISTKSGIWEIEQPAVIKFFGDATSLSDFGLRFNTPAGPSNQVVFANGIFSSQPSDSLTVALNEISLRALSGFADINPTLGGILTTRLAFSGGLSRPKLAGRVNVSSFALDFRILGDLEIQSSYSSASPDASVLLTLSPLPADRPAILLGTELPGEKFENSLTLSGKLRLPSVDKSEQGMIDLFVDIDRADLFFLKYIFNDAIESVSGYVSGDGSIKGSLSHPLFDLNLGILDGNFSVPITQSRYKLDGQVHIDEEAIHLNSARILDDQGGRADISGKILFNRYRFFSLDISGRLQELQIMNVAASRSLPFYGFLWASGDITLNGPLNDALLYSPNAVTRSNSELFIPVGEELSETDESFIVFEDSLGFIPDFKQLSRRRFILAHRPTSERRFLDGLNLDLSLFAPEGSTVHLVIDPLLGDVINAKSTGTVQLIRGDDSFQTFGQLAVSGGDYLFTAGELFFRKFNIKEGGTITWNGDPVNAMLDIPASYRTRASRSGLPGADAQATGLIPLIVNLEISGTVTSPLVDLSLSIDRANQNVLGDYQALEAQLNQPDRATEYATSVLLTNTFQLTTDNITSDSGSQLAFNSVSQLVSAQLNRFLNEALPNVDFTFGLLGESAADLDVTYGVALRLLDERLIIRGEGVYQGARATENLRANEGLQGEFVVEIRMSPRVSIEVFFRREGDILETSELTNTTGVGISYQTDFDSWGTLYRRITGTSANK